jgi:hypothetical protein
MGTIIKKIIRKIFFVTLPIIVIFISLLSYIFIIILQFELGLDYKGANAKYIDSLKKGNAEHALYWIEKSIKYFHKTSLSNNGIDELEIQRAYAIELHKRYEETMVIFNNYVKHPDADFARIYYKLGNKRDSFEEYCNCLYAVKEHSLIYFIKDDILLNNTYKSHLSPFEKYEDFLNFMEHEYEILHMPCQYKRAMSLYRAASVEIELLQKGKK